MAGVMKSKSVKRFGVRYGRKVRNKLGMIESQSKKLHKCPYCRSVKVKRISNGIFSCRKCDNRFTGRAYVPLKKMTVSKRVDESAVEAVDTSLAPEEEIEDSLEDSFEDSTEDSTEDSVEDSLEDVTEKTEKTAGDIAAEEDADSADTAAVSSGAKEKKQTKKKKVSEESLDDEGQASESSEE